MSKKIVIALGGNALGKTPSEQLELVKNTSKSIVDIIKDGNEVIIAHGNGPQVGMINLAMEYSSNNLPEVAPMPFAECGAMSQGYIGYHLQKSIKDELKKQGIDKNCVTLVTQVEVSKEDKAFNLPSKPIGMFYTKEQADKISAEKGYKFVEDAGRGYRRVVPSPEPVKIIELDVIKQLVSLNDVVITVGGGGIPVVSSENGLEGVAAVIDKDKSSARLAIDVKADVLLILTAVDEVCINFNKPNSEKLKSLTVEQAKAYIEENQFSPGSMLPKIEACIKFVENNLNGVAVITSLEKAKEALHGLSGTKITLA
ncbi:MAG: carbamate kinase [Clostridia bacterium]